MQCRSVCAPSAHATEECQHAGKDYLRRPDRSSPGGSRCGHGSRHTSKVAAARLAEDGAVPETYPLTELKSASYPARTEKNVKDSDGTLVLNIGRLAGGTKKTVEYAEKHRKPCLVVQLDQPCCPHSTVVRRQSV